MTSPTVEAFGLTDLGKQRKNNEDNFVIASLRKVVTVRQSSVPLPGFEGATRAGDEAHLLAVADGVGGRPGGELASGKAVQDLVRYASETASCFNQADADQENLFLERLEQTIRGTHETIVSEQDDGGPPPATTLTLAMIVGPRAYIIHIGDSRAYWLRDGKLRQITRDQTVGEYMVGIGAWTDTQAARAPVASALASAIGGSEITPVVGLVDLDPTDVLLLCTDGLTRHVADDRIAQILAKSASAETACKQLTQAALDEGGSDNITVIVARIGGSHH